MTEKSGRRGISSPRPSKGSNPHHGRGGSRVTSGRDIGTSGMNSYPKALDVSDPRVSAQVSVIRDIHRPYITDEMRSVSPRSLQWVERLHPILEYHNYSRPDVLSLIKRSNYKEELIQMEVVRIMDAGCGHEQGDWETVIKSKRIPQPQQNTHSHKNQHNSHAGTFHSQGRPSRGARKPERPGKRGEDGAYTHENRLREVGDARTSYSPQEQARNDSPAVQAEDSSSSVPEKNRVIDKVVVSPATPDQPAPTSSSNSSAPRSWAARLVKHQPAPVDTSFPAVYPPGLSKQSPTPAAAEDSQAEAAAPVSSTTSMPPTAPTSPVTPKRAPAGPPPPRALSPNVRAQLSNPDENCCANITSASRGPSPNRRTELHPIASPRVRTPSLSPVSRPYAHPIAIHAPVKKFDDVEPVVMPMRGVHGVLPLEARAPKGLVFGTVSMPFDPFSPQQTEREKQYQQHQQQQQQAFNACDVSHGISSPRQQTQEHHPHTHHEAAAQQCHEKSRAMAQAVQPCVPSENHSAAPQNIQHVQHKQQPQEGNTTQIQEHAQQHDVVSRHPSAYDGVSHNVVYPQQLRPHNTERMADQEKMQRKSMQQQLQADRHGDANQQIASSLAHQAGGESEQCHVYQARTAHSNDRQNQRRQQQMFQLQQQQVAAAAGTWAAAGADGGFNRSVGSLMPQQAPQQATSKPPPPPPMSADGSKRQIREEPQPKAAQHYHKNAGASSTNTQQQQQQATPSTYTNTNAFSPPPGLAPNVTPGGQPSAAPYSYPNYHGVTTYPQYNSIYYGHGNMMPHYGLMGSPYGAKGGPGGLPAGYMPNYPNLPYPPQGSQEGFEESATVSANAGAGNAASAADMYVPVGTSAAQQLSSQPQISAQQTSAPIGGASPAQPAATPASSPQQQHVGSSSNAPATQSVASFYNQNIAPHVTTATSNYAANSTTTPSTAPPGFSGATSYQPQQQQQQQQLKVGGGPSNNGFYYGASNSAAVASGSGQSFPSRAGAVSANEQQQMANSGVMQSQYAHKNSTFKQQQQFGSTYHRSANASAVDQQQAAVAGGYYPNYTAYSQYAQPPGLANNFYPSSYQQQNQTYNNQTRQNYGNYSNPSMWS